MGKLDGLIGEYKIRSGELLSFHNTMKVGGVAEYFYEPETITELSSVLNLLKRKKIPFCFLGGGTNIIFSDKGVSGVVIKFSNINEIVDLGNGRLSVDAGVSTARLLKYCAANNLGGADFLAGIPGTVGGAFCMNSGSMGGCMGDIVRGAKICRIKGNVVELKRSSISFRYRETYFGGGAVASVLLEFKEESSAAINAKIKKNLAKRKNSQPVGFPTAGSIFKNPPGRYAGEIIEQFGFKGLSVGGAMISSQHANFIVNKGGAKSGDIRKLIFKVGAEISKQMGFDMKLEVRFVGRM